MKIGFLLSSFYPATGGREVITFNQAKELVKQGHEVHIFTTLKKGWKKEEKVEGLHIHRTRTYFQYKYYLEFNPGWIKNVLKYKLDILHVQSFGFIMADIAVLLKKLFTKARILNTPHGPFMALDKYPWWQAILKKLYTWFEYPINRLYDAVIQVNPEQWKWMVKKGVKKENIHFIPNSIPKEVFSKVDVKGFKQKYGLENKLVISYLGRVQKYKGLDQVIQVLRDLLMENRNVRFLVMGKDAGDMKRLKKLSEDLALSENVVFASVDDEERLAGLEASEIFVLPSEWEAFGIVIIEAMARHNAVVSTKTEGGRFLIEDGKNGFLYDYKDVKTLKELMLKLVKDDKLRKQMIDTNYVYSKQFSTEKIAKQLEALYEKVLKK